uniref:Uncharacterized protein n=1 Tax=Arundo donax TaxID=35708 RepID=A0A0A9H290_ARUDO
MSCRLQPLASLYRYLTSQATCLQGSLHPQHGRGWRIWLHSMPATIALLGRYQHISVTYLHPLLCLNFATTNSVAEFHPCLAVAPC